MAENMEERADTFEPESDDAFEQSFGAGVDALTMLGVDTSPDEDNDTEASASDEATETDGGFVLRGADGKEMRFASEEEAWRLASMGKDATKKWQEASALRKEVEEHKQKIEAYDLLAQSLERDPEGTVAMIAQLAGINKPADRPRDERGRFTSIDPDLATDTERALAAENERLREQVEQIKRYLPELQETSQMVKMRVAAENAAMQISDQYGVNVTPLEIQHAMKQTGIDNPMLAWKAVNFDKRVAGGLSGSAKKAPQMPEANKSKTIPLDQWKKMDEAQMFAALAQGHKPPDFDPEKAVRNRKT